MKVAELIEELEYLDPEQDLDIKIAYNSGDYWRTVVAADIEEIEIVTVEYSDYHNKDKVIYPDDSEEELEDNARKALILKERVF